MAGESGWLGLAQALTGSTSTDAGIVLSDGAARLKAALPGGLTTAGAPSGMRFNTISGSGATVTLTAAQSGSLCYFDRAAGIVFTLPVPQVGLYFDFVTTVTITTNSAEVDTDTAATKMLGLVLVTADTGTAPIACFGNGTSHVKIASNGSTTGGIKGGYFRCTCVSSTVWQVQGLLCGSSSLATPFA